MIFSEVFLQQFEKMFSNIRFYISAESRIVPYDVSGTALPSSWWHQFFWAVFEVLIKSTVLYYWIVKRSTFTENILIARVSGNPFWYRFGNLFKTDGGWFELALMYNGLLLGLLKGF